MWAAGAARAGPGWADEGSWCNYYFSAKARGALEEWVDDSDAVNDLAVLHIFSEQDLATGLAGCTDDNGIPIRESMIPMKIDGGEYIGHEGGDHIKLREKLDFAARGRGIKIGLEPVRDGNKVFLKHLRGNNAGAGAQMFPNQCPCLTIPGWISEIVRVDKNIRIEKRSRAANGAHGARPG